MKAVTSIAFASLVLAFWPRAACAWDSPGHEQIADIAWTMLDSKTKTEIEVILKHGDPKFAPADGTGEASAMAVETLASKLLSPGYLASIECVPVFAGSDTPVAWALDICV